MFGDTYACSYIQYFLPPPLYNRVYICGSNSSCVHGCRIFRLRKHLHKMVAMIVLLDSAWPTIHMSILGWSLRWVGFFASSCDRRTCYCLQVCSRGLSSQTLVLSRNIRFSVCIWRFDQFINLEHLANPNILDSTFETSTNIQKYRLTETAVVT